MKSVGANVHPGVIYRALDGEKPPLEGTLVGKRKYVAWDSFAPWAGELAGELHKPPVVELKKKPEKKSATPKRAAKR